ncbi:HAD family hydrolase [Salininema proteolyticum]|uniref:HAD family hydrolase n=1 Tax=Salininema proteolyticum TaxID=1607685 RepID=A0ABV8TT38_9ACTN
MAISEVVWDMDGTLLDTARAVPAAYIAATEELCGRTVDRDEVLRLYPVGPPAEILARLVGRVLSAEEEEAYYRRLGESPVDPFPGVAETLAALASRGKRLAVFTGASHRAAEILLASAGIGPDVLIGGDEVPAMKPAPDGLAMAAQKLGREPGELAYVGDSPLDMRAASAAGFAAWSPSWGHMYEPETPADRVLDRPGEVLGLLNGF